MKLSCFTFMKRLTEKFSNLIVCLVSRCFIPLLALSVKCRGTRRPLCWDWFTSGLIVDIAIWFFELLFMSISVAIF